MRLFALRLSLPLESLASRFGFLRLGYEVCGMFGICFLWFLKKDITDFVTQFLYDQRYLAHLFELFLQRLQSFVTDHFGL